MNLCSDASLCGVLAYRLPAGQPLALSALLPPAGLGLADVPPAEILHDHGRVLLCAHRRGRGRESWGHPKRPVAETPCQSLGILEMLSKGPSRIAGRGSDLGVLQLVILRQEAKVELGSEHIVKEKTRGPCRGRSLTPRAPRRPGPRRRRLGGA